MTEFFEENVNRLGNFDSAVMELVCVYVVSALQQLNLATYRAYNFISFAALGFNETVAAINERATPRPAS